MNDDELYESVGNYTKFKLIEMLIDKHKDCKLDSLDEIEDITDDILGILSYCGLKYYGQLKNNKDINEQI